MERILLVGTILNNAGTNVAKGKMLTINTAALNFCNLLFSITYLISFFPKCITAIISTNTKIKIAHGKNGNRLKPVLTPFVVKSCREQERASPGGKIYRPLRMVSDHYRLHTETPGIYGAQSTGENRMRELLNPTHSYFSKILSCKSDRKEKS